MCYSAMVKQNVKALGLQFDARIQHDLFEELFENRLRGSGAKISRALELSFSRPENAQEKRIWKLIEAWKEKQTTEFEKDLFAQRKRLSDAVRKIKEKETKAALNDQRIATDKIEKLKIKLRELGKDDKNDFGRIFPQIYSPLVIEKNDVRVIMPFRYHLRPFGQKAEFDKKFDGTYNARRDRLKEVFWWKSTFGKNHAILVISKFWENVKAKDGKNQVLEFKPSSLNEMLVPCIFDHNREDDFTLNSFALITDEPNPEVAAAGHDRTPIVMKEEHVDCWLHTSGKSIRDFEIVFDDKQPTYFEHSVAS